MNAPKIAVISELDSPLLSTNTAGVGGRQIAVAALAKHIAALGYELDIFTNWADKTLPQVFEWSPGIRVIHIDAGAPDDPSQQDIVDHRSTFTAGVLGFIRRAGGLPYEIVHAHHWVSGLTAMALKDELGLPFVVTFHTLGKLRQIHHDPGEHFPPERIPTEERLVAVADRLIALCPQDEADLIEYYNPDLHRITLIPNGIDNATFNPLSQSRARQALGLDLSDQIILQTCRIVPNKGVANIIEAVAELKNHYQLPAKLLIVGGEPGSARHPEHTPETDRLKALAKRHHISNLVTFIGQQPQETLRNYYSAADVFATTPWYEPFGITPLEAMACGTPVVGSNVGGIKYSVSPGRTGLLVPPKDPVALADGLYKILSNANLRRRLGAAGIRRVQTHFTWNKVAKQTVSLYRRVAGTQVRVVQNSSAPSVLQTESS